MENKGNVNVKRTKSVVLIIIFVVMLLILVSIYMFSNSKLMKNIFGIEKEEQLPLFSYMVYDNQDEQNLKVLITLNSENGIEYLEYPNGKVLYGNGKNTVSIDYVTNKNDSTVFKVKEEGKNVKEERMVITDEIIEKSVKVAGTESVGYKTIEISSNIGLNGFKTYYQIGKNNSEWIEGEGKIPILDYDVTQNNLVNEDETITISAKIKNDNTGDTVLISKDYNVDVNSKIDSFEADSLLNAMEKYDFGSGKFKVKVLDKTYSLKVYSFDNNIEISTDTTFGSEEDVGEQNRYAQNMLVLKVNGDLTINKNVTISPYSNNYGGPKGMMIYCTGTITNNGNITNVVGAKAEGEDVYLWKNSEGTYEYIPATGGAGGEGFTFYSGSWKGKQGNNGANGTNRALGGGGSGAVWTCERTATSGSGSTATSYSGGAGGGAAEARYNYNVIAGSARLNAGGSVTNAEYNSVGGGAGMPSGIGKSYNNIIYSEYSGQKGTGGLLILYANNFIMNESGKINVSGKNGGVAHTGGGSSGGGSINIFYNSEYINNGNLNVAGGVRVGNSTIGGAGGAGSISIGNISTGTYQSTYKNY